MTTTIRIPSRFNGPVNAANGGYICGVLSRHLPWDAEFRLKKMIPVEQDLTLEVGADSANLYAGESIYITAHPGGVNKRMPPPNPGFEAAKIASKKYIGRQVATAYGQCFVCSLLRPDDGMQIHAGQTEDPEVYASHWIPEDYMMEGEKIATEFIYAALDCPGAYAAMGTTQKELLLGTFAVHIDGEIQAGEQCVVTAWCSERAGRKSFSHTALYGADESLVARADAIWFQMS